jgi:hypothetical protein
LWGRKKLGRKNNSPVYRRYIDIISNLIDIAIELRNVDKIMKNHPGYRATNPFKKMQGGNKINTPPFQAKLAIRVRPTYNQNLHFIIAQIRPTLKLSRI